MMFPRDPSKVAEIEFIMNGCHDAIDVEGGHCLALDHGYQDIAGWFGLSSQSHIISVARILFRMAERLTDRDRRDEIQMVLRLKHLDKEETS